MTILRRLGRELARRSRLAAASCWILLHPRQASRIRAERAWIFGAAVGRYYADNSAALHQHVRRTRPDVRAYWAIDRDSPDVALARAAGPVLFRDEVMTFVRALLAGVHLISHGVHDVPGCASRRSRDAVKVRLGHGLTALKRTRPRPGHSNRSANAVFDLVPVASEFEKAHKRDWDIAPERLVVSGLARFDTLLATAAEGEADPRRIVYMPTWREAPDAEAPAAILGLLASPALHALLERHDARMDVFLHANFGKKLREAVTAAGSARLRFPALSDPQRLFAEAGLLITDYSSVAWDMLYLDRPVLFYQFDRAGFNDSRGGYLAPDELPGPCAATAAELIPLIAAFLEARWQGEAGWSERMKAVQSRAFAFRDANNCERIAREIERRMALKAEDG